ncbi:MAG: DUF1295 domain-containing protein [Bacteroidales bacterium]
MTYETYRILAISWMVFAAIIFLVLMKVTAPYGRHTSLRWGPMIGNRTGWILMEMPGMMVLLYFLMSSSPRPNAMIWILAFFFLFHYIHRTFVFPFRIRTNSKRMPLLIALFGILFNLMNGFLLGYHFTRFNGQTTDDLVSPRFIAGALLFVLGVYVNWKYDNRLINLRKPGETGYKIPEGGLFRWVSCPNLLGEIIEWTGFAILCWNLAALSFLVWTIANLVPRAFSHHKWYKNHFKEYPSGRKAIVPFVI